MTSLTKLLSFIAVIVFASCNGGTSTTAADSTSTAKIDSSKKAISYPFEIGYSTQFEFIDPEKSKMVLDLWKDYDNNTLDNAKDKFADTVRMIFAGMEMRASRDSIIAATKESRNSYSSVESKVDVVMAVKSTDKKDDWVLVWGDEIHTDKNNKTDTVAMHEVWQLNKEGKVVFMQQYISKKGTL
jgi:hypothetical protein